MSRPHNWKGGRTRNAAGYVLVLCPGHPGATKNGYVYEHRLVMESALGRLLRSDELVHHVNERKDDNRLENLVLLQPGEHQRVHHPKGRQRGLTLQKESQIVALREGGALLREVARAVGLSEPTVGRVLRRHPIRCGQCGRTFTRFKALGMHLTRSHSGGHTS